MNAYDPFGFCNCDDLEVQLAYAESVLAKDEAYLSANGLPPIYALGDLYSPANAAAGAGFSFRANYLNSSSYAGTAVGNAITQYKTPYFATRVGGTIGVLGTGVDGYNPGKAINNGSVPGGVSSSASIVLDFANTIPGVDVPAALGLVLENGAELAWTGYYNGQDRANIAQSIAVMQATVAAALNAMGNIYNQMISNGCL